MHRELRQSQEHEQGWRQARAEGTAERGAQQARDHHDCRRPAKLVDECTRIEEQIRESVQPLVAVDHEPHEIVNAAPIRCQHEGRPGGDR
jgi:hypothetical protein